MFEWDEAKSRRNLELRGFDFAFAALVFEGDTLERDDTRWDYGERRVVAVGRVEGLSLVVMYTDRGGGRRIISTRRGTGGSDMATIRRLAASDLAAAARVDRERVQATTDEEIAQQIASDADTAPDLAGAPDWSIVRRPPVPDARLETRRR